VVRDREFRPRGDDLFNLHSTVAVHNLSSCLCFVARTRGENHDSSAPYPLDIIFRVQFEDPERPEITNQAHFKIRVWGTHESASRHLPRLAQNTDVLPRETAGLEIANDLVDRAWILKQTKLPFLPYWPPPISSAAPNSLTSSGNVCSIALFPICRHRSSLCRRLGWRKFSARCAGRVPPERLQVRLSPPIDRLVAE
jgi:hypothetical protein